MISDITIGQYYAAKSVIHRLDARIKIILTIASIVAIFLCKSFPALALAVLGTLLWVLLSRVPVRMILRSIRPIVILLIFTAIINIYYNNDGTVLWAYWRISITTGGIYNAVFIMVRIVCLVVIGSLLTYTTTPTILTDAIERLLSPLRMFRIKTHTFAMMMTLALRFIPVLIEEIDRIMNAQKARGADLESGGIISRAKALVPIFIPLLISAFRRAYELAFAMECRCYTGGEGRTRMKQMHIRARDVVALLLCAAFIAGIVLLNQYFTAVI